MKKFVLMSEPAVKCENNEATFKQIYSVKRFICFLNGLFLLLWCKGKSRYSRFPPNKSATGLVVIGEDSCSRGREFVGQHCIQGPIL